MTTLNEPNKYSQHNHAAHERATHTWLIDLIGLTLCAFIFYMLWLGSYPFFTPDEGRYIEVAREMIVSGNYITPKINGVVFLDKPILYYWLQTIMIHLFGIKEWALRFFPACFGIFGCAATYLCGRFLFNRRAAILSSIMLITSPLYFGGAHYANLDLEVSVWMSMTLMCFLLVAQKTSLSIKQKNILLYSAYIFSALAVLTKGLIGIALPAGIIFIWIALTRKWMILLKNIRILGFILFFAIVLPWYVLVEKDNPEFFHYFFVIQQFTRFLSMGQFNNQTTFWFYIPIVFVGFFPWSILLVQALAQKCLTICGNKKLNFTHIHRQSQLFFIIWIAVVLLFFSIPSAKIVTYILPVFPALALLTGSYLSELWNKMSNKQLCISMISYAIIGLLLALILFLLPTYQWIDTASYFTPFCFLIGSVFLIASVLMICMLFYKPKKLFHVLMIFMITNICFLLTMTYSANYFNQNSSKSLVRYLKTIIRPQDEIVAYDKYFQDIPLYLGQQIKIADQWNAKTILDNDNSVRELWYGITFQKTTNNLISEEFFWQQWHSNKRLFVFLNDNYFIQFKKHTDHVYVLKQVNDIMLVSNVKSF